MFYLADKVSFKIRPREVFWSLAFSPSLLPIKNPRRRHARHHHHLGRRSPPSSSVAINSKNLQLNFSERLAMRLLNDNVLYEFNVEQGGSRNTDHGDPYNLDSDSSPLLSIVIRYRKFQAPNRRPVTVSEQSIDLPLSSEENRSSSESLMSRILAQFEVPSRIGEQMAEHFGFFSDRLARRMNGGGRSEIPVSVKIDVKSMSAESAGGIRSRMESARAAGVAAPRRRREDDDDEMIPTRRSSIEELEKVRVGDGGRECGICLEELRVGVEVARMPCGHLYHCNCIAQWLQRTHFCPFCRFKMPC